MDLNRSTLGALDTAFSAIFISNLDDPDHTEVVSALANTIHSTKKNSQYNFLRRMGKVREWIGQRSINRFKFYGFTISDKKWEDTVEVEVEDIEDDNLGQYGIEIASMGKEMANHYTRLCTDLLSGGFTAAAYDGQYFFDTDHPKGSRQVVVANVSNKATAGLSQASLRAGFENLANMLNDRGEPMNIVYDTLFIHPSKKIDANKFLNAEFFVKTAGDGTMDWNETKGLLRRVIELPYLSAPNNWFMADTSKAVKPLILQIRKRPIFQTITDMNDEFVFKNDTFMYGTRARHNAGYSIWELMYGSDGTT